MKYLDVKLFLFVHLGILKSNEHSLKSCIADELNIFSKTCGIDKPTVLFHHSHVKNSNGVISGTTGKQKQTELAYLMTPHKLFLQYLNAHACISETNGNHVKPESTLDIRLLSLEDGKSKIVEISKNCKVKDLTESKLDSMLSLPGTGSSEPELFIVLSKVQSFLGFLPWHIRLTEI